MSSPQKVKLYRQDPNDQGLIKKVKEIGGVSAADEEAHKESGELTTKDFNDAARDAKQAVAEKVHGAQEYVAGSSSSTLQVTDSSAKTARAADTAHAYVDKAYNADQQPSYLQQAKDAATAVWSQMSPAQTAHAMERGAKVEKDCHAAGTPSKQEVRRESTSAAEAIKDAAAKTEQVVVDAAKYIGGRFTAPVAGDVECNKELVDAKGNRIPAGSEHHKGSARAAGERAADRASETAQAAKDSARDTARRAGETAGEYAERTKDSARNLGESMDDYVKRMESGAERLRERAAEGLHQAEKSAQETWERTKESLAGGADRTRAAAHEAKRDVQRDAHEVAQEARKAGERAADAPTLPHDSINSVEQKAKETGAQARGLLGSALDTLTNALKRPSDEEDRSAAAPHNGEGSLLGSVRDQVEAKVEEVKHSPVLDEKEWEAKMLPNSAEEALTAAGYIPSNTEDVLTGKASEARTAVP